MFAFIILFSKRFCYRPSSSFPPCPCNDSILVNNFQEIREQVNQTVDTIYIDVSNDYSYPFDVDFRIKDNHKVYISGNTVSHLRINVLPFITNVRGSFSLSYINVEIDGDMSEAIFANLSFNNVKFVGTEISKINSYEVHSDFSSLSGIGKVYSSKIYFDSKVQNDTPKRGFSVIVSSSSTDNGVFINSYFSNCKIHYDTDDCSIFFPSANSLINIVRTKPDQAYRFVYNIMGGKVIIASTTTFDERGANFLVNLYNNVDITIDTEAIMCSLAFMEDSRIQLFSQINSISHRKISVFRNASLYIESMASSINGSLELNGDFSITSLRHVVFSGDSLIFNKKTDLLLNNVKFGVFPQIVSSEQTMNIPSISSGPKGLNIKAEFQFENVTLINISKFSNPNNERVRINIGHKTKSNEYGFEYNNFIGTDIPLMYVDSLDCSKVSIEIDESWDPYENPYKMFTKERIIIEAICKKNCIHMRILENPKKVYQTVYFISKPSYSFTLSDPFITYDNFSDWTKAVSPKTRGLQFIPHSHMNSSFPLDFSTAHVFENKIDLFVKRSGYLYAEYTPIFYLNFYDGLNETIKSFSFKHGKLFNVKEGMVSLNLDTVVLNNSAEVNKNNQLDVTKVRNLFVEPSSYSMVLTNQESYITLLFSSTDFYFKNNGMNTGYSVIPYSQNTIIQSDSRICFNTFSSDYVASSPYLLKFYSRYPSINFDQSWNSDSENLLFILDPTIDQFYLRSDSQFVPFKVISSVKLNFDSIRGQYIRLARQDMFKGSTFICVTSESSVYYRDFHIPYIPLHKIDGTDSKIESLPYSISFGVIEVMALVSTINVYTINDSLIFDHIFGCDLYCPFNFNRADIIIKMTLSDDITSINILQNKQYSSSPNSIQIFIDEKATITKTKFEKSILYDPLSLLYLRSFTNQITINTTKINVNNSLVFLSLRITNKGILLIGTPSETPVPSPFPSLNPTPKRTPSFSLLPTQTVAPSENSQNNTPSLPTIIGFSIFVILIIILLFYLFSRKNASINNEQLIPNYAL